MAGIYRGELETQGEVFLRRRCALCLPTMPGARNSHDHAVSKLTIHVGPRDLPLDRQQAKSSNAGVSDEKGKIDRPA